ncbi:MAG: hypothetical protein R3C15_08875 [Thermoleophilia bacterium]
MDAERSPVTPGDVSRLASLAGLAFPEDDLEPVAAGLDGLLAFLAPLLDPALDDPDPLVHDPRWP